ncbi:MAG: cytochrome P450 [Chloroflexota bacterium]
MNKLPTVNIASREFKANPYPFYARLRAEAPVYRTIMPDKQAAWLITRYDDVMMVLKDEQRFVKNPANAKSADQLTKLPWIPPMARPFMNNLLDSDWAVHSRLRGLVHKAFTPSMIEQMRERVQALASELLDAAERKGHMDIIHDYAIPVPLTIISEILGISPTDQAKFHKWSKFLLDLGTTGNFLLTIPNIMAISRFLRRLFKERRVHPGDDLMTALVQAEESGEKLTEDELLAMVFVLLIAGHETTVNLIGSGTLALLENPDQMHLLRQKPALIKGAIEELLRFVSPVEQATERYAREEVTLHGITIPKGEMVLAVIASANRDESQFENPDKLDITRDNPKHVAFGQGVHYCVGAPLARIEGQIAISMLLQRMPALRLASTTDVLRWRPGLTVRGLEALPVAL